MNFKLKYLILVFYISFCGASFSQNETKQWYFGYYAGLDFNFTPPTIIANSSMSVSEGCSSAADQNGNLLFYTDGMTIWNSSHLVMANGSGLSGSASSSQSSLILKKPGGGNIYYVVTLTGAWGGLCYSIVDMSLAAGSGSVIVKNTLLLSSCWEQLAATKHCNGVDIWITAREFGVGNNNFKSFLLNANGINSTAVTSAIGPIPNPSYNTGSTIGCMKFSPNGKKLSIATPFDRFVCDFDSNTGIVSQLSSFNNSITSAYGCEFSPDGSKIYYTTLSGNVIYQVDLCNNFAISTYTSAGNLGWSSLQLAPNGRIYVNYFNQTSLSYFNNPNIAGNGANFVYQGQSISPGSCRSGLPNFLSSYFFSKPSPPPFSYTNLNQVSCNTYSFSAPASPTLFGCAATGYSLIGRGWDFGDPGSGSANTSTLANPIHVFTAPGNYTTQLILYYSCGGGTDTLRQTVTVNGPLLSINSSSITCANLGTATVVPSPGGSYSFTWVPTNQTSSVAIGLSPGNYTVAVHDNSLNCSVTNTVYFNPIVPLTGNLNSSASLTCYGASTGTANYSNVAGGSANQNYLWSNGLQSYTTSNVSTLSAGIWSSTVSDALTGCSLNNTFVIGQPSAQTLNLSSSSPTSCVGFSIILSGTNIGGTPFNIGSPYVYFWNGGTTSNTQTLSHNVAGTYIYTLNAQDAYSCAISQTIALTFIANPVLSVPNVFICPLETGTLSVSGASSYTWSNNSVGNTFTDSPLSNSSYTVVGEALGCTNTAVASINLKSLPNPVLSSNSPVCESSNFSLSATAGTAYVWSGPGGFSSFVSVVSIPSVSLTQAGVYNLTVTAANACTASVSHTVVVKPLPTLTLSASAASICLGVNAATLSASGTGTLNQWYLPGSNTSFSNNATVQVSPTVSSTYSVNTYLNGCLRSQSVSLSVISPPNLSIALSSNSFCAQAFNGSPNTITLTSSGASSYTLSTPNHFSNANPSGPASPINLMPPYTNSGVATATLFGSNGVCTVSTTAQFSVVPNPTASVSNPTPVICAGQSYTYTSSGAFSYVWSSSTPGSSLYTAGNVAVVNPSIQSVFSVYGSSVGCQSALQSYTLSVNPLPTVAVVPNPTYVCIGSNTELRAKSNGTGFVWYPQNITGSTILVAPTVKQQYTVVASLNNCTQSAVALVSVMPLPIARISNFSPSLCVKQAVSMLASGGISYVWKGPLGLAGQNAELSFVAFSKAFEGIYTVTVTDELGCKGTSQDTLRLLDLPTGNLLAGKEKGCAPFTTGFVFDTGTKPNERVAGVDWYVNQRHVSAATSYSQAFVLAGNYSVQVHVKGVNGCVNTSSLLVTAYPKPKADFSYSPLLPVENLDEVVFENSSVGAQEFEWHVRVISDEGLVMKGERVNYLFENPGLYPVVLLAKSEMGCSDTLIKTIKVEPDFAVYIPNAFTPNGDGKNEGFMPVMRGVRNFTLQIFNRWGQLLFESNTLNNTWDGSYRGVECQLGVYNYKLEVLTQSGDAKQYSGMVTLYR